MPVIYFVDVILKLCSLGLMVAAGGLWAGAGVETRPKYRDDQTLVGGAIWSQTIIPIGLIVSKVVDKYLDKFVVGYFLVSGIAILCSTGAVLITGECKAMRRHRQMETNLAPRATPLRAIETYDKIYFTIGVLSVMAATFKLLSCVNGLIRTTQINTIQDAIRFDGLPYGTANVVLSATLTYIPCYLIQCSVLRRFDVWFAGVHERDIVNPYILITGILAFGAYWTTKYLMTLPESTPTVTSILNATTSTI